MSYAEFHVYFTLPLFSLLLLANLRNPMARTGKAWVGTLVLIALALGYTTPWDSYLIREGIWSYSPESVLGTLYRIPYEEYFFMVIQTLSACLLLMGVLHLSGRQYEGRQLTPKQKGAGRLVAVLLLAGAALASRFIWEEGAYRYLSLILAWGLPVLLLQWSVGYPVLFQFWREALVCFLLLTGYFWWADWMAIQRGIWMFPEEPLTNVSIATHLPIEEALFFCVTNAMVIQGFILFNKMPLGRFNR